MFTRIYLDNQGQPLFNWPLYYNEKTDIMKEICK